VSLDDTRRLRVLMTKTTLVVVVKERPGRQQPLVHTCGTVPTQRAALDCTLAAGRTPYVCGHVNTPVKLVLNCRFRFCTSATCYVCPVMMFASFC